MTAEQRKLSCGTLYIVATPIGNLADITYRAVETLQQADLVAAEDTRHSRRLLDHYGVRTPLLSYYEHNAEQRLDPLLEKLQSGKAVALISDAGTPGIADPGYRLVLACHAAGVPVVPIPGPSASITALCAAGVPTDRFAFEGYLPSKAKARQDLLRQLGNESRTLVFYETPHRLVSALGDLVEVLGVERELVVARELTKLHEEFFRGSVGAALEHFSADRVRGELVLILPPAEQAPVVSASEALRRLLFEDGLSRRDAVKLVAKEYGLPRSDVYRDSLKFMEEEETDEQ
jgi:16S rRNA (cytidine1402-2'-O)-methyltransferase